ncbi:MAG TPA: AlpA family phage regulatory protein [Vicinamibacterales bacterium]|jgi:prophage regulatory protein|nr:AlpA family phage regulatory protein [Vicinamibacterales bacterium]
MTSDRLLTLAEVIARVGLKTTAIYDYMRRGVFPRRIVVGPRCVRWSEREVQAWIAAQIQRRDERRTT